MSPEKFEGIQLLIYIFLKQGVIVLTHSLQSIHNTPINPIRKADGTSWRLTQDLRAIHSLIILQDVPTILNLYHTITPVSQWWIWTRLAQGYVDSPAVFSAVVKHVLNTVTDLPSTVCVLNYTNYILISAET